jgi:hypothetical protein
MDLNERRVGGSRRRHPWEQARRRLVSRVLADELRSGTYPAPRRALDIGSGDAWLAGKLAADFGLEAVHALDIGYSDADCEVLRTNVVRPTRVYPDHPSDVVLLLDVIEHVESDVELLERARDGVTPGGLVMVTVPALPRLATQHDVALGHYRRYTPAGLRRALKGGGLTELQMGGAFSSLIAVRAVQRLRERAIGQRPIPNLGQWEGSHSLTRVLTEALSKDADVGRRAAARNVVLPGLTLWATAVRDR